MTVKDWDRKLDKEVAQFCKQEGMTMSLRFIPAASLDAMLRAAHSGDVMAQSAAASINGWMKRADDAVKHGVAPACGYCMTKLEYGEVCGWGLLTPIEGDGIGMMAAYCEECIQLDPRDLARDFMEGLEQVSGRSMALSMMH